MLTNIITFARLLLTFMVIAFFEHHDLLDIALIFIIAVIFILDALDGYIARIGIASNRESAGRGEYVPGPCTHRPSRHGSW